MIKIISYFKKGSLNSFTSLIDYAQTPTGKLFLLIFFSIILSRCGAMWWPMTVVPKFPWWPVAIIVLALMTFLPLYRRSILMAANLLSVVVLPWINWNALHQFIATGHLSLPFSWRLYQVSLVIGVVILNALYIYGTYRWRQHRYGRHSVWKLLLIIMLLIIIASFVPSGMGQLILWSIVLIEVSIIWYVSYTLLGINALKTKPVWRQFSHYLPFWGGSNTPFPKGAAYVQKIEAKSARELAVSQLGGLALIFWAFILVLLFTGLESLINMYHVPSFAQALQHCRQRQPYPVELAWCILISNFLKQLLILCINGHIIIAICRMAGFNALRNTYRPLLAPTIADFWNRYYFYFKELMVEVFFYPTYFRYFKRFPRLRLVFATMMAACVGNIIYHFLWSLPYILQHGLWSAVVDLQVYYVYALVLGVVISLSQLRGPRKPFSSRFLNLLRTYVTTPLVVVGFYLLLSIFNEPLMSTSFKVNWWFLYSLFH